MTGYRSSKTQHVTARASAPSRRLVQRPVTKRWAGERSRGSIACVMAGFVLVLSLSAYGVHSQMAQNAALAAERDWQIALATGSALKTVSILFVPDDGQVCRRRWIDNGSWTLRDGGKVDCEDAATWNIDMPDREQQIERRLGAIRHGFQARAGGKAE
jgi:hypothetical protein